MEIALNTVKTGRKNGRRVHAIYSGNNELWPREPYNASPNKILYVPFVMDGRTKYGTNNHFPDQNNDDIGYTFSSRTAVQGIDQNLKTNRFSLSFRMKMKSEGTGWANQGVSLGFGHFITLNFKHRESNFQNRFEYKSGSRWYAGPSTHGLNDGNRHFVTISMLDNQFAIWIDGREHRKLNTTPALNRDNKFDVSRGRVRLINDGNPQVEYAQVVAHKNGILLATHARWYNAMKEYFLSDYQ